nr:unnamed protein product [Callosobruchus chinensis]
MFNQCERCSLILAMLVFSLLSKLREHRWSSILFDWNRDRRSKKESSSSFLFGVVGFAGGNERGGRFPSGVI